MAKHDGNQEMDWKKCKAQYQREAQPLRWAENYKTAHIKGRRKAADRASKPPSHGRRMSSKQILDIREGKARVKPRHHQLVPSQYGTWWGHGSEVRGYSLMVERREKTYFAAPIQALSKGTSCWDDRPPKRGKVEGRIVRCMPWGIERENTYAVVGKGATDRKSVV